MHDRWNMCQYTTSMYLRLRLALHGSQADRFQEPGNYMCIVLRKEASEYKHGQVYAAELTTPAPAHPQYSQGNGQKRICMYMNMCVCEVHKCACVCVYVCVCAHKGTYVNTPYMYTSAV